MVMKKFTGFSSRSRLIPIPSLFFTSVLPYMDDIAEIKVTLHVFWAVFRKKGYPRFVTRRELLASGSIVQGIQPGVEQDSDVLDRSLAAATRRGTLLHLRLDRDGDVEDLYFINNDSDRRAVEGIRRGEVEIGGFPVPEEPIDKGGERNDIFSLYESNIGILTPMIAEELKDAEKQYSKDWIEEAIREAVDLNKRNWRYVARILERWSTEGKQDGRRSRYSEKTDPSRYYKSRYVPPRCCP